MLPAVTHLSYYGLYDRSNLRGRASNCFYMVTFCTYLAHTLQLRVQLRVLVLIAVTTASSYISRMKVGPKVVKNIVHCLVITTEPPWGTAKSCQNVNLNPPQVSCSTRTSFWASVQLAFISVVIRRRPSFF